MANVFPSVLSHVSMKIRPIEFISMSTMEERLGENPGMGIVLTIVDFIVAV